MKMQCSTFWQGGPYQSRVDGWWVVEKRKMHWKLANEDISILPLPENEWIFVLSLIRIQNSNSVGRIWKLFPHRSLVHDWWNVEGSLLQNAFRMVLLGIQVGIRGYWYIGHKNLLNLQKEKQVPSCVCIVTNGVTKIIRINGRLLQSVWGSEGAE